jgi:hypothetical protein
MKKDRDMRYTYKGFVCLDDKNLGDVRLGVLFEGQIYFMPISDPEQIYEQLPPNSSNIVIVEFRDGTEPVDFNRAKDGEFEDIFIWIQDLFAITIDELDGYILTFINENEKHIEGFSEAVENAFTEDYAIDKIKKYKDYTEKWVETH